MTLTVKKVKTFNGMEGPGFECYAAVDGSICAHVLDEGCGGPMWWQVLDADVLKSYAASIGAPDAVQGQAVRLDSKLDEAVAAAVDEWEWQRKAKRISRTRTLFRLPTDPAHEWRTLNAVYSDQTRDHIRAKYPTATIWNEVTR